MRIELVNDWKEQAEALFFIEHLTINDISKIVRKARETVSRHLCDCDGYDEEMAFRKVCGRERRREYQRDWDATYRKKHVGELSGGRYIQVTAESVMSEHELAVRILSRERFFNGY